MTPSTKRLAWIGGLAAGAATIVGVIAFWPKKASAASPTPSSQPKPLNLPAPPQDVVISPQWMLLDVSAHGWQTEDTRKESLNMKPGDVIEVMLRPYGGGMDSIQWVVVGPYDDGKEQWTGTWLVQPWLGGHQAPANVPPTIQFQPEHVYAWAPFGQVPL